MTPSFIYFDLDNTLLDHSSAEAKAQQDTYQNFEALQHITIDEWLSTYRLVNHSLWERYQKGEVDRPELQHSRFFDTMKRLKLDSSKSETIGEFYLQSYRKYWSWIDGAQEALTTLSQNFEVGILTNGFKETQQLKFDHLKLQDYCKVMIITEEVGKLKPHPKVFDVATERSGVSREEIFYVGDSYTSDIEGGRNAGWKTAWYTGMLSKTEPHQTADFMFEQFPDLLDHLGVMVD